MLVTEKGQRGGGSAGVGSMPVNRVPGSAIQAIATIAGGIDAATDGMPAWHPEQAMTAPVAALPSQHGHGSPCISLMLAAATTATGKATHTSAASRATQRNRRVAVLITGRLYPYSARLSEPPVSRPNTFASGPVVSNSKILEI